MLAYAKSGGFMEVSLAGPPGSLLTPRRESSMPRQARVALLGLATASLLSLMVDFMLKEMGRRPAVR